MNEQSLFAQLLDIPDATGQAAFLDRACGGDADLRQRLDRLLNWHHAVGNFLESSPVVRDETATFVPPEAIEGAGARVGPYQLLELIGQGGMGEVFMAEQSDPVRRRVAFKVIKPGMDSKQVIARFEAERQALALLEHPNIARVYDGGATPSGRPYFVMELVRGLPITEYCDQAQLTIAERLELFVQLCRAVQHAHQKGIIHRDLKPSNVLVTVIDGQPVPKVIDFGIAKATGAALTDRTLFTGFHQMIGTPLYMSPEQAELSGVDVDTRADIYSLGVILYELLTGTTPFDPDTFRTAGLDEMRRIIREDVPARPSKRLSTLAGEQSSTIAERRKADTRRLGRLMRSEMDWVVMRALEKDRSRRYESASAFAGDIERYLANEPVQAAPPSMAYRARKFARRNRAALAIAVILGVAALTIGGSIGWGIWDRSSRRANAETAATMALEESAKQYRANHPESAMASAKRAHDALTGVPGTGRLQAVADQRVAELEMAERLEGLWLESLDSVRIGPEQVAAYFQSTFQEFGIDPAELSETEVAERIRDRLITPELVGGLDEWAGQLRLANGLDDPLAVKLRSAATMADQNPWSCRIRDIALDGSAEQMSAFAGEIPVADVPESSLVQLSLALSRNHRSAEAETLLRRAVVAHPDHVRTNFNLGLLLKSSPGLTLRVQALGYYRAALAVRPRSPTIMNAIGINLCDELAWFEEAADVFRESIRIRPDYPTTRQNLANTLTNQGFHAEALVEARAAVRLEPGRFHIRTARVNLRQPWAANRGGRGIPICSAVSSPTPPTTTACGGTR